MAPTVACLSIAPVKSTRLQHPDEVFLSRDGVAENRRFYFINKQGRLFNASRGPALLTLTSAYDLESERLAICFPDGRKVEGTVPTEGRSITTIFWGRPVRGRIVEGEWADAVSEHVGEPLRMVRAEEPGGGVDAYAASIVSTESVEELARQAGRDEVDSRRFRMLIEVKGVAPHEEDSWVGRRVRLGDAEVRVVRPDPRCVITTMNPETGSSDLDTLKRIRQYRNTGPKDINFGVYADVEVPGRVRVGDAVAPL